MDRSSCNTISWNWSRLAFLRQQQFSHDLLQARKTKWRTKCKPETTFRDQFQGSPTSVEFLIRKVPGLLNMFRSVIAQKFQPKYSTCNTSLKAFNLNWRNRCARIPDFRSPVNPFTTQAALLKMPIKNSAHEMLNKIALFSKGILHILSLAYWARKPTARRLPRQRPNYTRECQQNDLKLVLVFSSPFFRRKRSGSVIPHVFVFS